MSEKERIYLEITDESTITGWVAKPIKGVHGSRVMAETFNERNEQLIRREKRIAERSREELRQKFTK